MSERLMLPVLPLRETVVFPGVAVPISAGRPGTLQAIEAALGADRRVFAVAQRENRDEVEIDNLYTWVPSSGSRRCSAAPGGCSC
jgi:ATP-dependent Lon protease